MISLKQLCINVTCNEFERFYFAFTVSDDNSIKQSFEFLKRRYSSELGSGLFQRQKLKDEYLEFLINEHLKFLDEQWLITSRYQNSMKDVFCRIPNLTEISCFLRNDEILENIVKFCPKIIRISAKIVEMNAECSFFMDHGVTRLCEENSGSPELKKLSIDGITVYGVKHLIQNLKSLETFHHKNVPLALYSLHKDDLPNLENVPSYNLVEMKLVDIIGSLPYYNDILKICLTVCPKLKSLWCSISGRQQLDLFNNTCLENLRISFPNGEVDQKISIDGLLKNCGRNLVLLAVHHFILSVSQLVTSCCKLEHLFLDNITLTTDNSDSNAFFPHLVNCAFCRIGNNPLSDKAVGLLLSSPNLEHVTFCFCELSPDMKTNILKCCENCPLTTISFSYTIVDFDFVKDILLSCPSLKSLNLENCEFEDKKELLQFAETLANKPRISFLFL